MRRRFKCDPKWITVRYPAKCAEPNCQTLINAGDRAFYYPSDRAAPVAVTGKRPSAILPCTGSTKTATEQKQRNKERRF